MEEFRESGFLVCTRDEVGGELLSFLAYFIEDCGDVFLECVGFGLIALGEDDTVGSISLSELIDKRNIDRLWCMSAVNQYTDHTDVGSLFEVVHDHIFEVVTILFTRFGVAIAGEIDEMPVFMVAFIIYAFDLEVVDQLGLARLGTGSCKFFFVA